MRQTEREKGSALGYSFFSIVSCHVTFDSAAPPSKSGRRMTSLVSRREIRQCEPHATFLGQDSGRAVRVSCRICVIRGNSASDVGRRERNPCSAQYNMMCFAWAANWADEQARRLNGRADEQKCRREDKQHRMADRTGREKAFRYHDQAP